MICFLFLLISLSMIINTISEPIARFPLQISASITITAHLIEEGNEYPPRIRHMDVYYDYIKKRARVDIKAGYEAEKFYIRRYDLDEEYMVRSEPINDCKRSYLGEIMPFPSLNDVIYVQEEVINGIKCNYFLHEDYNIRIHIYMSIDNNSPIRLIQESVDLEENGNSIPLLTYDYSNISIDVPNDDLFQLPSEYPIDRCDRHTGGFPFIHIFHHFVKI